MSMALFAGHRRGGSFQPACRRFLTALAGPLALTACTTVATQSPTPVVEKLDPVTGTTVVLLSQPVELVTEQSRGPQRDPFAFTAPFEIDRMGDRRLYLWVSTPQEEGAPQSVHVLCNGEPLALSATSFDLRELSLSRAPYQTEAPWSRAMYFQLSDEALQCLATAHNISAAKQLADGSEERFSAAAERLRPLGSFAATVAPDASHLR
jgi:hypothetical protein